jgi:hypothetical protein
MAKLYPQAQVPFSFSPTTRRDIPTGKNGMYGGNFETKATTDIYMVTVGIYFASKGPKK